MKNSDTLSLNAQILLEKAIANHQNGQLGVANSQYLKVLKTAPQHFFANYGLGTLFVQTKNYNQAVEFLEKAIAIRKDYFEAYNNLAIALRKLDLHKEALKAYHRATKINSRNAKLWSNIATVQRTLNKPYDALKSLKRAIVLEPKFFEAHNYLGNIYRDLGESTKSENHYKKSIALNENYADAMNNLGMLLMEDLERNKEGQLYFQKTIEVNPKFGDAYVNYAEACRRNEQNNVAIEYFQRGLQLGANKIKAFSGLGNLYRDMGVSDKAGGAYRAAIANLTESQPPIAEMYRSLAMSDQFTEENEEVEQILTLFSSKETSNEQKAQLGFALGKIYDDLTKYDQAIEYYWEANKLHRASYEYSIKSETRYFQSLKTTFNEAYFGALDRNNESGDGLIFVLGMPRSGTSLIEQVLASHSSVYGAGERTEIYKASIGMSLMTKSNFPFKASALTKEDIEVLSENYKQVIRDATDGEKFFVDKMPGNFLYIGLIATLFPRAKIIHCRRNAMDTCISIFKNYFVGNHPYAYNFDELMEYYLLYEDLISHWHYCMGNQMFELNYETVVDKPEQSIRTLLDYCGLEFEESCLNFHETQRNVRTISAMQVKQPIYKTAINGWKKYGLRLIKYEQMYRK